MLLEAFLLFPLELCAFLVSSFPLFLPAFLLFIGFLLQADLDSVTTPLARAP